MIQESNNNCGKVQSTHTEEDELLDKLSDLLFDIWNEDIKENENDTQKLHN